MTRDFLIKNDMLLLRSRRSCKLKPFKIASKQLQGNGIMGKRSTSGGFDEYLPVVEMLLDHFETDLKGTIYEEDADRHLVEVNLFDGMDNTTRSLLQAYIKLGWKKLDKYYRYTLDFCCLRGRSHFPSMQEVVGVGSTLGFDDQLCGRMSIETA